MALEFLTDLVTSIGVVLVCGWIFQIAANNTYVRDIMLTQSDLYVAINRFTPRNLVLSYVSTVEYATRTVLNPVDATGGPIPAIFNAVFLIGKLMLTVALAVPSTLSELFQQTNGLPAWIVLVGFTMAMCSVFGWLAAGDRVTIWRVLLAAALSPAAVSLVFLLLQAFMVVMFNAFFWFTALAPFAVACPVVCTLYWVVFPHAERGATNKLAGAIVRMLEPPQN